MTKRSHSYARFGLLAVFALQSGVFASSPAAAQSPLAIDVAAPELLGGPWLNTPQNKPIKFSARKGKVTIVEFWTFG